MTSPAAATTAADGTRVYRIPRPDTGEIAELPSANTVNAVLDRPGLNTWKLKLVAKEVGDDEDLAATARIDPWAAVREAFNRNTDAADTGTAVHSWTEHLDAGGPLDDLPDELRGYGAGYLQCKADHGIEIVHVERTTFNHKVGYAGTLDRIIRLAAYEGSVIADIKTGKGVWPEAALQCAGYAHGEGLWDPDAQRVDPMPDDLRKDVAFAIHLDEFGRYELTPLDLTDAWRAFRAIVAAWTWVNRHSKTAVCAPLANPIHQIARLEDLVP